LNPRTPQAETGEPPQAPMLFQVGELPLDRLLPQPVDRLALRLAHPLPQGVVQVVVLAPLDDPAVLGTAGAPAGQRAGPAVLGRAAILRLDQLPVRPLLGP